MGIIKDELAGAQGGVRRRAPHRDPRRDHRPHHRGPARRRGHGGHHHARRLHQADPRGGLPQPEARRQGRDRDGDQGRGHRRGPLRRLDALLPPVLHQQGQGALAQGPRDPGGRPPGQGQGDGQRAVARRGRAGGHLRAGARLRVGRLRPLRHQAGQGEEDRAVRLLAPARGRHPGHHPRGRRRGDGGPAHRRPARGPALDQAGHDHPLPGGRGPSDGPHRRRRARHRRGRGRPGHRGRGRARKA